VLDGNFQVGYMQLLKANCGFPKASWSVTYMPKQSTAESAPATSSCCYPGWCPSSKGFKPSRGQCMPCSLLRATLQLLQTHLLAHVLQLICSPAILLRGRRSQLCCKLIAIAQNRKLLHRLFGYKDLHSRIQPAHNQRNVDEELAGQCFGVVAAERLDGALSTGLDNYMVLDW
jgi:hypothetical protein